MGANRCRLRFRKQAWGIGAEPMSGAAESRSRYGQTIALVLTPTTRAFRACSGKPANSALRGVLRRTEAYTTPFRL